MSNNNARRKLLFRQVLLILTGIVIFYLAAGFVRQARISHQRNQELDRLDQEILAVEGEIADLGEVLVYVESPEAAEKWARENGMTKEGEVSVVVVAPTSDLSPGGEPEWGEGTSPATNREAWWDLFFGRR